MYMLIEKKEVAIQFILGKISSHYLRSKIICIVGFIGYTTIASFVGKSSRKCDHGSFMIAQTTSH